MAAISKWLARVLSLAATWSTVNGEADIASKSESIKACNNSPELCYRIYSSIIHLGAHDSPFLSNAANNNSVSGNQNFDTPAQLDAGVRLLQAQMHDVSGGNGTDIRLCHTSCSLNDAGPLSIWLASISDWLERNPYEVVTLLLVNGGKNKADQIDAQFTASGIKKFMYYLPPGDVLWSTLSDMISWNARLVVFVDSIPDNNAAPYLLDEFTYIFENPYEARNISEFSCLPDRPPDFAGRPNAALESRQMFLMNHFLGKELVQGILVPDKAAASQTNSGDITLEGSLGFQMRNCYAMYIRSPTFVLVDWFDVGPAISVMDGWNGLKNTVGRKGIAAVESSTLTQITSKSVVTAVTVTSTTDRAVATQKPVKSGASSRRRGKAKSPAVHIAVQMMHVLWR
jgi:hypothetical protein